MTSILISRAPETIIPDVRSPSRLRWTMGAEGVIYVGQRASVGEYFGTVRYVGPVPTTKGDWVGIEWDDTSRGKHNGTKDGVSYFTCESDTGGSFVRPHKLSTGISLSQALVERYASYNCKDGTAPGEELYFEDPGTAQKTKVEAIGMEQVQKVFKDLKNLTMVGLRFENISHPGDENFLLNQAPNIQDLDLSKNLFHEWESIAKICQQLKMLQQLNVSGNIMQIPQQPDMLMDSFASLHTLILNSCSLKWSDVVSCLGLWPNIVELYLDKNKIKEISRPENGMFARLKVLGLATNPIQDWKNVLSLSNLSGLEELILNECELHEAQLTGKDFVGLKQICLSGNKFDKMEVFNQLNNLKNLEKMMFRKNPVLLEETADTMREIIVAKIARLKMLNRSIVDTIERQGAEMDYLKKNGRYWRESGGNQNPEKNNPSPEFTRNHPRYMELVKEHGACDDAEFFVKSTALKSNLLDVIIAFPDTPDIKPLKKKLPRSMTVAALKMMIFRITKFPIKMQRLEYVSQQNSEHVVSMAKDNESLHFISMESGDMIKVLKKWSDVDFEI
uniref:tubulin-specific chaperone E-like n=1 Tax=Styela clava TaxID=7725 RepID=UPI001939A394|nr:tubulin-specific chaperone E-like [Styela clava]